MVSNNLLDLRAEPDHSSERINQLFFGQPVKITTRRKGFARVCQFDRYTGWVDERFLTPVAKSEFIDWPAQTNAVISRAAGAACLDADGRQAAPYLLLYGTLVRISRVRHNLARIILPNGDRRYVKSAHIRPINRNRKPNLTGSRLLAEARRFLGVPYLWGGVSPLGFDCSGLVQTLLAGFGIGFPRDTCRQIEAGKKVERDSIKTGDLLFFDRHVGLAIGRYRLLHSSRGGGGVRINGLIPGTPDYRADLDRDYNMARRIL